ncbi:MAG TPA: cytochrome c [Candidatus Limnocylindrales bacterium]|nr:cytochrome c [Candidatus Limnocylindrales bacterium]
MGTSKRNGYILMAFAGALTFVAILLLGAGSAHDYQKAKSDQQQFGQLIHSLQGPDLYRAYCASCHGTEAKGDGPVAPALNSKVPDLTMIAKNLGGVFPEEHILNLISGDEVVLAHGSREMPVWGPIFHQVENDRDYGNVRLHNLTEYLRSIQQK